MLCSSVMFPSQVSQLFTRSLFNRDPLKGGIVWSSRTHHSSLRVEMCREYVKERYMPVLLSRTSLLGRLYFTHDSGWHLHRHMQTTNAIESLFSNVRQRT